MKRRKKPPPPPTARSAEPRPPWYMELPPKGQRTIDESGRLYEQGRETRLLPKDLSPSNVYQDYQDTRDDFYDWRNFNKLPERLRQRAKGYTYTGPEITEPGYAYPFAAGQPLRAQYDLNVAHDAVEGWDMHAPPSKPARRKRKVSY